MKKLFYISVLLCISIFTFIASSEVLLRISGFEPWKYFSIDLNRPTVHEPDQILGWRNKPGKYQFPPYHPSGEKVELTFLPNNSRNTGKPGGDYNGELIFVGGSFTQGAAISDHETFPWKLQKRYPSLKSLNFATSGYGTYQSLLMLEKIMPDLKSPKLVIYGFIVTHEMRNIAHSSWLEPIAKHSRQGNIYLPYVTSGKDKNLIRNRPEKYIELPFREKSALIAFAEKQIMEFKTKNRKQFRRLLTGKLVQEMDKLSKVNGAKFIVALLQAEEKIKKEYISFLEYNNISYVDCSFSMTKDMTVLGEGHPNGKMNSQWAECISERLDSFIPE
ncbi:MAG: hypothetical protein IMF07_05650 [Proteobacteria bacterium]|nr:hypothetical protein [Pseudomonadota bacterium]